MKIRIYIVTYNGPNYVQENLRTLSDTVAYVLGTGLKSFPEVFVINNHDKLKIDITPAIELHNCLRSNFSFGHLSRNWNQALINGFESLSSPACDLVITSQDDVLWHPDAFKNILSHIQNYEFITYGSGDCVCVYRPEHVIKVGLWDERFCGIGHQEADYFLRSVLLNPNKTSLNDPFHSREHNLIPGAKWEEHEKRHDGVIKIPPKDSTKRDAHMSSLNNVHNICEQFFVEKWQTSPIQTLDDIIKVASRARKELTLYPYFYKADNQEGYP